MTDRPAKREWLAAIRRATWPSTARTFRETAKELSNLMRADGSLEVSEADMVKRTGLPGRTLRHHLTRLIEMKWLIRIRHGGRGRDALYWAHLPDADVPTIRPVQTPNSRQQVAGYSTPIAGNRQVSYSAQIAGKLVAGCKNPQRERSEHGAVDPDRDRRTNHDVARADATSDATAANSHTATDAPLAKVIPLRPRRHATTTPTPTAPPADDETAANPATHPADQPTPSRRRGTGGPAPWPPATTRDATTQPAGAGPATHPTSHSQRPLTSAHPSARNRQCPHSPPAATAHSTTSATAPRTPQTPPAPRRTPQADAASGRPVTRLNARVRPLRRSA